MNFIKRAWAEINITSLVSNLKIIKECSHQKEIMAIVKADAYGHGVEPIILALQENGVKSFGVSNIEEALELRTLGIKEHILILGYTPKDCIMDLCKHNISQAVYNLDYAKELSAAAEKENLKLNIHIKLDTGMGRIGFDCRNSELNEIGDAITAAKLPGLTAEGVFTHFAESDDTTTDAVNFTSKQINLFKSAIKVLRDNGINPEMRHCNNSAAIFTADDDFSNYCRPGIILYGLSPSPSVKIDGLRPVMTFKSVVSMVKKIKKGDTLSYGRTFTAEKDMLVATVTAGYGDGFPRKLSSVGTVIVNGYKANILGRICMDQFLIDITDIKNVKIGDTVTLFGEDITATDIAQKCDTINYEIICGISKRVPRIIVN